MACDGNRYNTGNPICSNDLRDLNDDTIIIDGYVNSEEDTVKDRFGIDRLTLTGIQNKADSAIDGFTGDAQNAIDGFEQLIDDKIVAQGGVEIAQEWGDSPDKALSQGFLSNNSSRIPNTKGYYNFKSIHGLTGIAAVVNGEDNNDRDLPNIYINGTLKSDGLDYVPFLSESMLLNQSRYSLNGGQLSKLKRDLCDPLVQKIGVNFIGDSNMWGRGTGQDATYLPRSGRLSDARDHFKSNSFVNIFKRFIGKKYFNNAQPILSNYPTSPSGQSIATYIKNTTIFPYESSGFKPIPITGTQLIPIIQIQPGQSAPSTTGWRVAYTYRGDLANDAQMGTEFVFTGESFDIIYTKAANCQSLNVFVNDDLVYTINAFSDITERGVSQTISFPYVKDATVRFTPTNNSQPTSNSAFYIEAININKTLVINNNGIIGASSSGYIARNLEDSINNFDKYFFVQFGGNDRMEVISYGARCISLFTENMKKIKEALEERGIETILMATSDGVAVDNQLFTRQDAANSILFFGEKYKIDVIDNFSVLNGTNFASYTNDGTHMTIYGNAVVSRNIITALESS